MANFIPMIGLDPAELVSVRTLVYLLRHPDPVVPELTLQALSYLEARASGRGDGFAGSSGRLPPSKTRHKWREADGVPGAGVEFTCGNRRKSHSRASRGG